MLLIIVTFIGFVLRIWQAHENSLDKIILTWGVNISGLVYLGNKLSDIQPHYFNPNTVIFKMRGGYFTSYITLKLDVTEPFPFIDHLNVIGTDTSEKVYRCTEIKIDASDAKSSYNVKKLQKLHSLQISIRNKSIDAEMIRDKIDVLSGLTDKGSQTPVNSSPVGENPNVRYAPQPLTMNSLNKMLQVRIALSLFSLVFCI